MIYLKKNLNIIIFFLIISSKLYCLIPYISPGISIGFNSNKKLFLSSQISIGMSFLNDHYDLPDNFIDYFVPSISFGIKFFPKRSNERLFRYIDIQSTIGFVGIGRGIVKGIDNDYRSIKNKLYIGYLMFYQYEMELNNHFTNKSFMFVLPIPFYELY